MSTESWRCEIHGVITTGDCPKCDTEMIALAGEPAPMHHIISTNVFAGSAGLEDGTKVTIGKWIVRIVRQGDTYGASMGLTHDKADPLVEFYDSTHPTLHIMGGQFVARYYASTLLENPDDARGLCLMGSEPAWTVDAPTMRDVRWFIDTFKEI